MFMKFPLAGANRQRKSGTQSNGQLYALLEPRQLLATTRTLLTGVPSLSQPHEIVADYQDDFAESGVFGFHWNAPANWRDGVSSGDMTQGNLRQTGLFRDLFLDGEIYRASETSEKANWPANFLQLDKSGGHVGAHRFGDNAHNRYAIVSYEAESSGFYSIVHSHLSKTTAVGDRVDVRVWVGQDQVQESVSTQPIDKDQFSVDFDANLGFVTQGEKIFVAIGAGGNHVGDHFELDFSIAKFEGAFVAGYGDDFGRNQIGWSYYWNAPDNWMDPVGALGEEIQFATGRVGDLASYRTLTGTGSLTPDGNLDGHDNLPASFLRLTRNGGVVGGSINGQNSFDRFAISAFEVANSGYYAITDSVLEKLKPKGNGLELLVHDSDGEVLSRQFVDPLEAASFDMPLGYLAQGEKIYVAVGANGDHVADVFRMDFTVVAEPMLRRAPVRDFESQQTVHVSDYGAIPDDGLADHSQIQSSINAAIELQRLTGDSVTIQLEEGTYRLEKADAANLVFSRAASLIFQGAGEELTELMYAAHDGQGIRIADSENLIFREFSIDHEALPFTQGSVQRVVDQDTLIVEVDPGYVAPNDPVVFDGGRNSHRTQFLTSDRSGRLINNERFVVADLDSVVQISDTVFEVSYRRSLPASLSVGDAWYQATRINDNGNFGVFRNDGFITISNVTSYAGPAAFVHGQGNHEVNVLDSRVNLKDGRLVSVLGDGVHASRNEVGVWVEGSTFVGLSDDAMNIYRHELEVEIQQVGPNRFTLSEVHRDLIVGERVVFYRADGFRAQARIVSLDGGELVVDRPIDDFDSETRLAPLDHATRGSVIRDNVMERQRAGLGSIIVWSPNTTIIGNEFRSVNTHGIATNAYQAVSLADGLIVQGNQFDDLGFSSFLGERNWAAIEVGLNTRDNVVLDNVFSRLFGDEVEGSALASGLGELPLSVVFELKYFEVD
jgi:hypothetical protein